MPTPCTDTTCNTRVRVDRVLVASTSHMPNLDEDLSPWDWGSYPDGGTTWFYAYDNDPECGIDDGPMPEWLLKLCIAARKRYNCNWVMLDPDGDLIPGLPTYEH